jgi:hypothetical protein
MDLTTNGIVIITDAIKYIQNKLDHLDSLDKTEKELQNKQTDKTKLEDADISDTEYGQSSTSRNNK